MNFVNLFGMDGYSIPTRINGLDPIEIRKVGHWEKHRWPEYAQHLFTLLRVPHEETDLPQTRTVSLKHSYRDWVVFRENLMFLEPESKQCYYILAGKWIELT